MRTDTGEVFRLDEYRPSDYLIPRTHLLFCLSPEETRVIARLTIQRRDGVPAGAPLLLDGDGLHLTALRIDGAAASPETYTATPDRLTIQQPPEAPSFEIEIETIVEPALNTQLMGLYRSGGIYCTQCEAEGFRRITYFLDRPDVLSVYTVRMEASRQEAPLLLSNGNPAERGDLGNGRHYAVWHDPFPKPSYLFALVAGDLGCLGDRFVTRSGRPVELGIYVEHGKEPLATYAMDALKRSLAWDEQAFGREYDLDVFNIVAVSDFNMGAMENKGLNIFNDKYVLADERTATDADFANIEAIIAHEYFHNWTGNRITCRDWFQLCLKEGLTVFRDHEFSADMRSRPVKRIAEVRTLRAHQFPEDQGPLSHPVRPRRYREINNFYTATVYEKGSEVVRMIRTILGPETFRAGMDLYFERHDGDAATIEDFLAVFEEASGRDLSQFALWYHQAGTPNVSVSCSHDAAKAVFTVEIEQSMRPTPGESRKRVMHIPLAFGLVGPDGRDLPHGRVEGGTVEDGVIHLRRRRQTLQFPGVAQRPVLSINRGFSAPVTLTAEQGADDLAFLARHDRDAFNRWQALNTMFTTALIAASRPMEGTNEPPMSADLFDLVGAVATDETLEPAFRALAITLPSEADIAREIGGNIDPQAIHRAREMLLRAVASANAAPFRDLYARLSDDGPFTPDAAGAGRRALRNALLDLMSALEDGRSLASGHFERATNMTDRAAALAVLCNRHQEADETAQAVVDFERMFRDHPLVLDKWFTIQASAPGPGTLAVVRSLMKHSAFSIGNPNRVRSLLGTFFTANQTGFHRADGAGYDLFAEAVCEVERRNPQVAARIATGLRSWRSLEPGRRELARRALARVAATPDLSTDLRDIIERTLA
jgi:aminopeptidase N